MRLRAERIAVRYGRVDALLPVSFDAAPGSLTIILGPNGAGKTSLVKALAGAAPLRSGRIFLGEEEISWIPAHRRLRLGVALVPEGRGRLPGLSVLDNLALGWHAADSGRRRSREADLDEVFELFPRLKDRLDQDCGTLSGGEMQMLAIARALLAKPHVLLLDEPSLGLAPLAVARVYEALEALIARGLSMVLVEQKAVPLRAKQETTIVLRNGRMVFHEERRPTVSELTTLYLGERAEQ